MRIHLQQQKTLLSDICNELNINLIKTMINIMTNRFNFFIIMIIRY